jgi:pyruvate/2-oxoglutarate dehydrogenase complex dihydrolipoamide acyltransferase (E2) component
MRWAGRKRAKNLGTFSISSLGHLGALNGYHPLVTTSSLAIGPIEPTKPTDVVLLCDHRVLDGVLAAVALASLEEKLMKIPNVILGPQAT